MPSRSQICDSPSICVCQGMPGPSGVSPRTGPDVCGVGDGHAAQARDLTGQFARLAAPGRVLAKRPTSAAARAS